MNDEIPGDIAWGSCQPETLIDWFQGRMKMSGLTRAVIEKCSIILHGSGFFTLPYHTIDAIPTLFVRQRNRYTQQINEPDQSGAEFKGRYTQAKGSKNRVYWPPLYTQRTQYNDPSVPLIVCEGELKAIRTKMACAESGIDALVCGVPGTKINSSVYDDLQSINCITTVADIKVHRTVFLALDWNGKGRSREASSQLEMDLRDLFQRLGASVVTVRWPLEEGSKSEQKIDEWLANGGDLSAALQDSLNEKKAQNTELQEMWDRLNSKYAIMHGSYIPLSDMTRKYSSHHLTIMEPDLRIPVGKNRWIKAPEIWGLQPPTESNVVEGHAFHPNPLGWEQDRYVWEEGKRMLNTAPEWGWEMSPFAPEKPPEVGPFLALIERLCQNNGDWYIDFLAQIAQHPTIRGHHIIMFQDEGNTGKDRLFDTLSEVFRGYCGPVGTSLTSSFNSNMEHLLIPFWSDPVVNGRGGLDRALESMLKNYSGTTYQEINHKGGAKYAVRNYGRLHIAMNLDWLVKIAENERRYGVFGGLEAMPHEWAVEYMRWLHSGGVDQIRRLLTERDISHFDIFAPAPRTSKRVDMELASRHPIETFLADEEWVGYKDIWGITELCDLYKLMCGHHVPTESMGKAIRKHHDSYAHDGLIKTGGRPLRMAALRRGKEWKARMELEGNKAWTAEYSKKRAEEVETNTKF